MIRDDKKWKNKKIRKKNVYKKYEINERKFKKIIRKVMTLLNCITMRDYNYMQFFKIILEL
jgi:hypothetical protein